MNIETRKLDALGRLIGVRSILKQMEGIYFGDREREKVERIGKRSGKDRREERTAVREAKRKFEVLCGGVTTVMNGLWEFMEEARGWKELVERREEALKEFEELGDVIERWRETIERAEVRCEEDEWEVVEEE